jgi:hypothetical protein
MEVLLPLPHPSMALSDLLALPWQLLWKQAMVFYFMLGLEISGLNAEEQSDISLLANWAASQNVTNIIEVFTYYDVFDLKLGYDRVERKQHPW